MLDKFLHVGCSRYIFIQQQALPGFGTLLIYAMKYCYSKPPFMICGTSFVDHLSSYWSLLSLFCMLWAIPLSNSRGHQSDVTPPKWPWASPSQRPRKLRECDISRGAMSGGQIAVILTEMSTTKAWWLGAAQSCHHGFLLCCDDNKEPDTSAAVTFDNHFDRRSQLHSLYISHWDCRIDIPSSMSNRRNNSDEGRNKSNDGQFTTHSKSPCALKSDVVEDVLCVPYANKVP